MLGAHTRLTLSLSESAVLDRAMATFGQAVRWAHGAARNTLGTPLEPELKTRFHLLSTVRRAVVAQVERLQSEALGRREWLRTSEGLRIEALAGHIERLDRQIQALETQISTLTKPGAARTFQNPAKTQGLRRQLATMKARRFQKNRKLRAAQHRRDAFSSTDPFAHRVFGSRKLLAQRHRLNEPDSPFPNEQSWRAEWARRRNGELCLIGCGSASHGTKRLRSTCQPARSPCACPTIRPRNDCGQKPIAWASRSRRFRAN